MKENWLMPGAVVPVDVETTAALVAEIKRLIGLVGDMALKQAQKQEHVIECPRCGHCCPQAEQDRHILQAKGEHPAPCARHCEANAFQIEIRSLKAKLEQAPVASNDTSQERVDETAKQRHDPTDLSGYWYNRAEMEGLKPQKFCKECGFSLCRCLEGTWA